MFFLTTVHYNKMQNGYLQPERETQSRKNLTSDAASDYLSRSVKCSQYWFWSITVSRGKVLILFTKTKFFLPQNFTSYSISLNCFIKYMWNVNNHNYLHRFIKQFEYRKLAASDFRIMHSRMSLNSCLESECKHSMLARKRKRTDETDEKEDRLCVSLSVRNYEFNNFD